MKLESFKLIITHDNEMDVYVAWPANELFSGLIVQTDTLEEIPNAIAKSFEAMLEYGFKKEIHDIA